MTYLDIFLGKEIAPVGHYGSSALVYSKRTSVLYVELHSGVSCKSFGNPVVCWMESCSVLLPFGCTLCLMDARLRSGLREAA